MNPAGSSLQKEDHIARLEYLEAENLRLKRELTSNEYNQKFFKEFSEGYASYKIGDDFFSALAQYLADKTQLNYVLIGKIVENDEKKFTVETIAITAFGKLADNIDYPLPDGPCEQVVQGNLYTFPRQCRELFPKNQTLAKFNVEGYLGYPLFDSTAKAIGLIALMHETEINETENIISILKIVAKRAEMELERIKYEEMLEEKTRSLEESNFQLEQSNKNLEQFAFVASHDLQEPLRKIETFGSLLYERHVKTLSEEARGLLDRITGASKRMAVLIKDLLEFSQIMQVETAFQETDLNKTLKNVLKDFDLLILQKNATVNSDQLPVIDGISVQLNQLFYNLISNSLKYAKDETAPMITISCRILTNDDLKAFPMINQALSYCEIIFKDNGIGFEQEYAEQIFLIFRRLNSRSLYAGTGIGLAICQKIIHHHHGHIFARSQENEGSDFHIILPLKQSPINRQP